MKILISEDDPIFKTILENNLKKWGYQVVSTSDGRQAWDIIRKPGCPNVVISDWMMPEMDGLQLCRKVRAHEAPRYIYFIILTAKGEQQDILQGLEAGADDFLTKPIDYVELKYRIRIGERIIGLEEKVLELARKDSLTGTLNRRAFMEKLDQELERAARKNTPLSLLMTDIDHFKQVNDRYGHLSGDRVLKQFVSQMAQVIRPYDFIGRYGGEEFILCLPDCSIKEARDIAERMRSQIETTPMQISTSRPPIHITASFGISLFSSACEKDPESLIKKADDALYSAKNDGRNCVRMAQP
ncbi:GGDEF domain-containing response regulator [Desulfobacter curvatus]|uniref:GGDEF domain-containing response regulator n=1 Tax=Desulfobacter curvatus TaxID=2290 RepID=UPI000361812C|nr:diguanylate cyclase [Desulfobacter curvatus]